MPIIIPIFISILCNYESEMDSVIWSWQPHFVFCFSVGSVIGFILSSCLALLTSDNHQVIDENEVVDTALPQKKKLMGISSSRGSLLQNPYSSVKEILLRRIVV
jgi:hypothetical protein